MEGEQVQQGLPHGRHSCGGQVADAADLQAPLGQQQLRRPRRGPARRRPGAGRPSFPTRPLQARRVGGAEDIASVAACPSSCVIASVALGTASRATARPQFSQRSINWSSRGPQPSVSTQTNSGLPQADTARPRARPLVQADRRSSASPAPASAHLGRRLAGLGLDFPFDLKGRQVLEEAARVEGLRGRGRPNRVSRPGRR